MRQVHRAGEKTFIDFSGKKPSTLHACGTAVRVDGRIGPETTGAVRWTDEAVLMAALRSEAAGEHRLRVARDSDQTVFERGRLSRAYS